MIIVQYIEEAWNSKPPNLMPKDPYDRAIARFWAGFIDDKLGPCLLEVLKGQGEQQQKAVEESVANFILLEEALQASSCVSSKAYFGGDEIGLLDIALGGMLVIIKTLEKATNTVLIDAEKMPLLSAWMDRFSKAEGVKEVLPDAVKLYEYMGAIASRYG
jgi:glutathione S-transferase